MVTNKWKLRNKLYENPGLHVEEGEWQMIFCVNTILGCCRQGYAAKLIRYVIQEAKNRAEKALYRPVRIH